MPGATNFADDDIQFLYEKETFKCQFCMEPMTDLSPDERNSHYNVHLDEQDRADLTSSSTSENRLMSSTEKRTSSDKENIFWFPAMTSPPPKNFTPGLISVLKCVLIKTHAKGLTTRAVLCHDGITHVATELWDAGWGCGYRNFLMACTALMNQQFQPMYFPLLDDEVRPPGVRNLQHWIEGAWADGFDREGAEQLKHKIVKSRRWIGTGELYAAFTWRGIPAQLIDFPGSERGPAAVVEWVVNYFSTPKTSKWAADAFSALKGASPIILTEKMPLILQHAGHSRTVVGYEINKKGEPNLLIFDPSHRPSKQLRQIALAMHSSSSPNKRGDDSSVISDNLHMNKEDNAQERLFWNTSPGDGDRMKKRVRSNLQGLSSEKNDNDIIDIDDGEGNEDAKDTGDKKVSLDGLDPMKTLNAFRVSQTKLAKKDRYQILCFPLDPPLEEHERWSRRVVTSETVV
ncbi:DUF1671-domain-containing protein [Hysterangium stoloniferum]|nr:DUF1671-domain-containing protein [Hysterangium stoloniferum]